MSRLVELFSRLQNEMIVNTFCRCYVFNSNEFKRKVFVLSVKVLSPYSKKWVNASSFMDRKFRATILTFCRRGCLSFLKFEQWRR